MKITYTDTFFKSLKKLHRHNMFYYKVYSFFRYDIVRFFKNIYIFRKDLYQFQPWDYMFNLKIFKTSLEQLSKSLINGNEVDEYRFPKVKQVNRAIEILNNVIEDNYSEMAEKQLNMKLIFSDLFSDVDNRSDEEKANTATIMNLTHKLEEDEWNELWDIIKGYDYENGTGIKSWWD